ncbi:hypothetical protein G6F70_008316 [Rhizopus microsporus]|uniref:Peptidase S54 rhomboid domain-containing protein n=2 Tax=Rhizopus TaxID=4842 RepID=A0A367J603_RHIAZ|nr:hypothetical protein G6F71_008337 [Rhizopus microsporus]RCH85384.1 hypothetical protein CU097_007433 [Rhizopus azygosporus]KAG1195331.1 hypothetical protein G6F70_008316 [Rhizopus microsporus]KAG1207117.1 hypothetical protein G6F69_008304 [Rhizopus microsporus]KAG1227776.1 hypothetical protein G6F67_008237 [Rhizopus microsporus]
MLRLSNITRNGFSRSHYYCRSISTTKIQYQPRLSRSISNQQNVTEIVPPLTTNPPLWSKQMTSFPHIRYISPTLFGIAVSVSSFVTAAVIFDRNQQTLWDRFRNHGRQWSFFEVTEESMLRDLWREKRELIREKREILLEKLQEKLEKLTLPLDVKRAFWMLGVKLATMTESEKTLSVLIALNSLVFIGWQIPRFIPFMSQWFLHLPGTKRNLTLLTSCFSHQEFFHFALNMVGLWSFGRVVHDTFGREQFLAMYLSAGVGANVVSHACSLALRNSRPLLPSLGASGAIYGLVASTAILHPNSSISLIFLPMIPIKLGYALPALMSFDLAGILLRWKMFDHFAHLAGAGLGIGYTYYGERHIWAPLVRKVHEIRENSRNGGGRGQGGVYIFTETQQRPETMQSQTRKWTKWF